MSEVTKTLVGLVYGLVLSAATATAAEFRLNPGMTGFPDLGAVTCAEYVDLFPIGPTGLRQAAMTWAQGYFYARSEQTTDEILAGQAQKWTFNSLTNEIVAYCEDNPDARIPDAVKDLWVTLSSVE